MSTIDDVLVEERRASKVYRDLERARKAAQRQRETVWQRNLRVTVRETRARYRTCKCDFSDVRSKPDLMAMKGCTHPRYICPCLDAVRRSA